MSQVRIVYTKVEVQEILRNHVHNTHKLSDVDIDWQNVDDAFAIVSSSPKVESYKKGIFE